MYISFRLVSHSSEENLWDFLDKGIKRKEFCFCISKVYDMKNDNEKTTNLKYKDGSSRTEDDSLIAKHEVGSELKYD